MPAEKQCRMGDQLCLYCLQRGHYVSHCPKVAKRRGSAALGGTMLSHISSSSASRLQVQGTVYSQEHSVPIEVLVDSGADENVIDSVPC